jgi:hypothetical protein
MNELSFGMRLQKPKFCPEPIATLLNNCFSELPEQRPAFQEIKSDLDTAYNSLLQQFQLNDKIKDKENSQAHHFPIINSIDNSMKSRYTAMIKGNKKQMKQNDTHRRKSNEYLSMRKNMYRHNSVTLESVVDLLLTNETHEHLKIGHANKWQNDNIMAIKEIEASQSFNELKLKEQPKRELKRSLSEP